MTINLHLNGTVHMALSHIWRLTWHEDGFWFNLWSFKIEICQAKQQVAVTNARRLRKCGSIAYCSMRMDFRSILFNKETFRGVL